MLTFEQPLLLLLLIPIGILVLLTWRRMSLPFPRSQRYLILASRLALFTLIVTALAGATVSVPISRQAVVFVGDISASTKPQRTFIEHWINEAIHHKRPEDQVGIVAVGRNALVEQSVRTQIDFSQFESTPDTNFTNLAAGLRLAAAILPQDSERRIVLLSDGQQNLEDALQEAQLLQQEGIRIDVVPLPAFDGPEARIDGLNAPSILHTNERFLLHAHFFSTVAQRVTLHLYLDQTLLLQQSLQLIGGEQEVTFTLNAPPTGFHTYHITMDAPQDTISQNDEAAVFVNVQGPPHILVIEGRPGAGHNITSALQATHIDVTVGTPVDVPATLEGLVPYDAVVLADVPAVELGLTRMQVLQSYVRDLGRGLVVSGGENSYGVGGYANTPLEETLPVRMEIPQHKDTPTIAVVLIIESLENNSGVNISKEAGKGVVSLLTPRDYIGVSAAFGNLVIPLEHVTDKAAIDQTIDKMNPNDPLSYLPDLQAAETALLHTNAKVKHVILLGDGDATDSYAKQVLKMASEHISVSVVGTNIGSYDDLTMMQQIAAWGKGRYYQADNPNAIPRILLNETQQAARRAFIEEPFVPAIITPHTILTGLGSLPQLTGYVATTPKPAAQIVLASHLDDPVLAVWQYGLGRVVAWTSDTLGLWTANWLQWSDAARWWANLVTWTISTSNNQLIVNSETAGGNGHVIVDSPPETSATSGPVNQQQVQVRIIAPDLSQQTVMLQPIAPERWEGTFPTTLVGAYLLRVTWQARSSANTSSPRQETTTTGLVVPYSPEFSSSGTDMRFLNQLARAGDGNVLNPNDTASAFSTNLPPVYTSLPIVFWLFAIAALLLPIDIALRRLSSLEFLVVGYHWLLSHLGLRKATLTKNDTDNLVLDTIRSHREERRNRASSRKPKVAITAAKPKISPSQFIKSATLNSKKQQEVSMTEKLLEAKRKRSTTKTNEE
jgi:uncharacterized membrane protein